MSRQTVSKWENGSADPSTTNLLALAKLYGVEAEDLLRGVGEQGGVMRQIGEREPMARRCGRDKSLPYK